MITELTFLLWNLNIILESLPISSSGHIKLIQDILYRQQGGKLSLEPHTEHVMHIPNAAIISVFLAWQARNAQVAPSFSWLGSLLFAAIVANLITGLAYLFAKEHAPRVPLALGFCLSGSLLLSLYSAPSGTITTLSLTHGLIIGCAQTLALLPGISRMTMTVTSAIWLGIDPTLSFTLSLLCELLLIIVAVGAALVSHKSFSNIWPLPSRQLIMIAVSSIISFKALGMSQYGFATNSAVYFGWYLLALSIYTIIRKPLIIELEG